METEKNSAFTTVKSTVELYKIRHVNGCYWADITIDANGREGRISIASDWGNWSNYWGACGEGFKSFLASINMEYAANKFGVEQWIDVKKSLDSFNELVGECERYGTVSKAEAIGIRAEIKELRGESAACITEAVTRSRSLYSFLYGHGDGADFIYKANPHFAAFWAQAWPVLLAEFASETEAVAAQ